LVAATLQGRRPTPAQLEHGYVDDVVAELRNDGRVKIDQAAMLYCYPDTTLVVIFRVSDRLCPYGVRDRIWDEGHPEDFDAYRRATSTYLRWLEALDIGELPHQCNPDSSGVTWFNLWGEG
jgi:hypothetical protein